MKKKFFAVALATTMALSTALTGTAATADVNIVGAFSANTGDEDVTGNFDVTYTFTNACQDTAANWNNFSVEIFDGNGQFITLRADAFGWTAGEWKLGGDAFVDEQNPDVKHPTFTGQPEDWATWIADMKDADVTVNIKRTGSVFAVKYDIKGASGATYNFATNVTVEGEVADALKVHITGEKVNLTNVKFTNDTAGGNDQTPTTTAGGNDQTPTTTAGGNKAPAPTTAGKTTPKTGDVAPVAALAAVAVVACAAVVVSKKKVTE